MEAASADRVYFYAWGERNPHFHVLVSPRAAAVPPEHRGAYAESSTGLAPELLSRVRPGDVVLVKGSLGSRMAVIVEALKNREPAAA